MTQTHHWDIKYLNSNYIVMIAETQMLAKKVIEKNVLVCLEVHKRLDLFYADTRDCAPDTLGNFQYMYVYMSQPNHQLETFKA